LAEKTKDNPVEICCGKGNGSLNSTKGGELIIKLRSYQLRRKPLLHAVINSQLVIL
jgi:hypothetical protein